MQHPDLESDTAMLEQVRIELQRMPSPAARVCPRADGFRVHRVMRLVRVSGWSRPKGAQGGPSPAAFADWRLDRLSRSHRACWPSERFTPADASLPGSVPGWPTLHLVAREQTLSGHHDALWPLGRMRTFSMKGWHGRPTTTRSSTDLRLDLQVLEIGNTVRPYRRLSIRPHLATGWAASRS